MLHFGVRTRAAGDGRTPKVITSGADKKGAVALLGRGGVSLVRSTMCFFLLAGSARATIEIICKSSTPPLWLSSRSDSMVTVPASLSSLSSKGPLSTYKTNSQYVTRTRAPPPKYRPCYNMYKTDDPYEESCDWSAGSPNPSFIRVDDNELSWSDFGFLLPAPTGSR